MAASFRFRWTRKEMVLLSLFCVFYLLGYVWLRATYGHGANSKTKVDVVKLYELPKGVDRVLAIVFLPVAWFESQCGGDEIQLWSRAVKRTQDRRGAKNMDDITRMIYEAGLFPAKKPSS